MASEQLGELIPQGGGDPIPLLKEKLVLGRRETCDIVLRFGNVSGSHCELSLESGYWFVKDLNSRNGTRVNGYRVTRRRIDPKDVLSVGKHQYEMLYSPADLGATGPPPDGGDLEDILGQSLMDSAGLSRKSRQDEEGRIGRNQPASQQTADEGGTTKIEPPQLDPAEGDAPKPSTDNAAPVPSDDAVDEATATEAAPDSPDSDYNLAPDE